MQSEMSKLLSGYREEYTQYGFRYVKIDDKGDDMKGYSYFRCMDCKKPLRVRTAGLSKEAYGGIQCPCGKGRYESISKTEYDELTHSKKILLKKGETRFKPPRDKTTIKHLSTFTTRLGQDTYVLPVTEKHGRAKIKEHEEKMVDKGKGKGKDRDKQRDKPRRRRSRVLSVDEATGITHVEEGQYPAELLEIKDIETSYGDSLRWMWEVDVDGEPVELSGISSRVMNEKSHAFKWASALLGGKLEVGDEVSLDDLEGLKGMVDVEDGELRDGTEISNVVDVHSMKKGKDKQKGKEKVKEKGKGKRKARREEDEEEEEEDEELDAEFGDEEEEED